MFIFGLLVFILGTVPLLSQYHRLAGKTYHPRNDLLCVEREVTHSLREGPHWAMAPFRAEFQVPIEAN